MSANYPADPTKHCDDHIEAPRADIHHNEPFVPVYARRGKARGGQGRIRTWMILTPVAVLVLGGIGAILVTDSSGAASAPLAEPAATAPVLPIAATVTTTRRLTGPSTPDPVAAAPAIRDSTPLRRIAPAPARREAVRSPEPAATPRTLTPAPAATGPQSYTPAPGWPSTEILDRVPVTPMPTPAPTPPLITIEPVG
jgi:hypothetical protein